MKILITLSRFPYPPDKGDKLRAWNQIQGLSKNHEIYLFCLSDEKVLPEHIEKLSPYCKDIEVVYLSRPKIYLRLIRNLFGKLPFQIAYFTDSEAVKRFHAYFETVQPDLIYCQLARMAEFSRKIRTVNKMIDFQDAFSKGLERRIDYEGSIRGLFLRSEHNRLKQYEADIFADFHAHSIISKQDAQYFRPQLKNNFNIVPNGVDTNFFKPEPVSRTLELLFTGNMGYEPNVNCVQYIIQKVFPFLPAELSHIKLVAAGKNPSKALQKIKSSKLHLTGWVDDLRLYYRQANIFLAPMQIGIGMQNKILEAMSMGIPVITSSLANNAIGGEHGKNIWVADTPQKVAEGITYLLSNTELAIQIGRNARQFMIEQYSWQKQNELLNVLIQENFQQKQPLNQVS